MRLVTLLGMGSTEADARHLQSITQQLSQATEEIQTDHSASVIGGRSRTLSLTHLLLAPQSLANLQ